jgi:hypothetical protein
MRVNRLCLAAIFGLSAACADSATSPLYQTPESSRIVSGQPDNGAHPYVGLLVFDDKKGPLQRCSGALLSSTVVLTAGHCTLGAVAARIWMNETVAAGSGYPFGGPASYEGVPYTSPDFCIGCNGIGRLSFLTGDIGVVVLSEPVPTSVVSTYMQLPPALLANTLATGSLVTLVGYGVQTRNVGGGRPFWTGTLTRLTAPTSFVSGEFFNSGRMIRLTANASQEKGGLCYGDSGGPDLVGTSDVGLAVNSYVNNTNCAGVTYSTRIDLPGYLSWISSFLD